MAVLAHILTRDSEDGWATTHAPLCASDQVWLDVHRSKATARARRLKAGIPDGTGDEALDGFNSWAGAPR